MPLISHLNAIKPYVTRDGSLIFELMHPLLHGNKNQSLAQAIVEPGQRTVLHRHHKSEELYHITAGEGEMTLAEETFRVQAGDTVCIPPGNAHCIANCGERPLYMLCMCSPPYSHEDTELL